MKCLIRKLDFFTQTVFYNIPYQVKVVKKFINVQVQKNKN